ncbi:hypothetical protein FGB62_6g321 [Gracilaria domingensis]|nr:hypothetical protein FGB62_6g321 [Gracilaria domingensis]
MQANQLANISGFLLPNRLHIESYRTLQTQTRRGLLDVSPGMIVFIAALAMAKQNGVEWVYGLAIEDDPQQHRRLLRYLKRFGGQHVMKVRDDLSSVPARIFYGGFGTIIRGQVDQMLRRGLSIMQRTTPSEQRSEYSTSDTK